MRPALVLWIVAVVVLSLMPLKFKLLLGTTGPWHSWGHYFAFLITILIAASHIRQRTRQLWIGALTFLFASVMEGSEVIVYHNAFEWHDVLIDGLGILTGLVLLRLSVVRPVVR